MDKRQFDEQYNLAFIDEELPRASIKQALKHYAASVAIYGFILLFLNYNPWFGGELLSVSCVISQHLITGSHIYGFLFSVYVVLAPIVFIIGRPRSLWTSKNLLILGYLWRLTRKLLRRGPTSEQHTFKPNFKESNALMFLLIKVVYGPLMLACAMYELNEITALKFNLNFQHDWLNKLDIWFLLFVSGICILDSTLFFIGYTTESGLMRNRLRYAETNVFRILVCIVCYQPFNMVTISIFGPSNYARQILYQNNLEHPMTWVLRGFAVLFLLILISSSLSLFTKASNLTNRGIVKIGPYAVVRHPGYIAKNLFWLTTLIPLFVPDTQSIDFSWGSHAIVCGTTLMGFLAWGTLYFLRAMTEEQFLSKDPEYVEYCQKVKYRFIPWVY